MLTTEKSLPPYIVNCFYEAGYDSLDAIIEMNDDSISEIEQYIDERKSDLPHCMRDATDEKSSRSFKFPPGHKIRIRKFIMKHKDLFSPQKPMKSEIVHQKSSNRRDVATQPKSKKQKLSCEDIPTTTEDIRRKIVKWTKRYENEETGRTVAEGQDFVIQVKKSLTDSSLCHATIECRCGNSYVVTRNPKGEHQITNWSRHFKTCISEKSKKRSSQQTLKMFVKANQPPPAKDMLRPSLHDLESLVALSAETLRSTKANPSPGTQYQQIHFLIVILHLLFLNRFYLPTTLAPPLPPCRWINYLQMNLALSLYQFYQALPLQETQVHVYLAATTFSP